jgi:hypothetical protein
MRYCLTRYVLVLISTAVSASACSPEPAPGTGITPPPAPGASSHASPGTIDLSHEGLGGEPSSFVALAGNWVIADDEGQKVVLVDGRTWTTGTPPSQLDQKAALIFPDAAPAFARRVSAGLKFPFAVARDVPELGDGEISVRFKLVSGESDQFASILFGLQPNADHLAIRYNTKDHDVALWRVRDGERERIHHGGTEVKIPLGEWRQLRLVVDGANVEGYIDDRQVLAHTLPEAPRGRVGLWAKADSVTAYKDYRVTPR